jgi:hypothetical protein
MNCEAVLKNLQDYSDEELIGTPQQEIELHLQHCESCSTSFHRIIRLRTLLQTLPQPSPPSYLKEAILSELKNQTNPPSPHPSSFIAWKLFSLAAVLTGIALFLYSAPPFLKNPTPSQTARVFSSPEESLATNYGLETPPTKQKNISEKQNQNTRLKKINKSPDYGTPFAQAQDQIEEEKFLQNFSRSDFQTETFEGSSLNKEQEENDETLFARKLENNATLNAPPATTTVVTPTSEQIDKILPLQFKGNADHLEEILHTLNIPILRKNHSLYWLEVTPEQKKTTRFPL